MQTIRWKICRFMVLTLRVCFVVRAFVDQVSESRLSDLKREMSQLEEELEQTRYVRCCRHCTAGGRQEEQQVLKTKRPVCGALELTYFATRETSKTSKTSHATTPWSGLTDWLNCRRNTHGTWYFLEHAK